MGTRTENLDLIVRARQAAAAKAGLDDIASSLAGIGAAAFGLVSLKSIFTNIVTDSAALQSQMIDLGASVKRAGYDWDQARPFVEDFTSRLQQQKGVIDDYSRESLQLAIDYTKDLATAESLVESAADLAAAKHMELSTATDLLGRAFIGHTETLARYGLKVKEGASDLETFRNLQREIDDRFGGASAASVEKITTKWDLLLDALQGINESLGKKIGTDKEGGGLIGNFLDSFTYFFTLISFGLDNTGDVLADFKKRFNEDTDLGTAIMKWQRDLALAATGVIPLAEANNSAIKSVEDLTKTIDKSAPDIAKPVAQLKMLFEDPNFIKIDDWWNATQDLKTMAAELYDSWKTAYDDIGTEAERAAEVFGDSNQQIVLSGRTTTVAVARSWTLLSNSMEAAMGGAINFILGQWAWLQSESKNIWDAMAKDFVKYFIDEILKRVAGKLVGGILDILSHIFDTPANDRMAMKQGQDFADYFYRGAVQHAQSRNWAQAMTSGAANFGAGPFSGGGPGFYQNQGAAASQRGVTIIINGAMTREFITNVVIPEFQRATAGGFGKVSMNDSFATGREVIAFT